MNTKNIQTALLLTLSLSTLACGSAVQKPATAPDQATASPEVSEQKTLELTIKPAATAAPGGQRLPLQFTLHNPGDQPVHACLAAGRVVHFWGIDREYAYTVAKQDAEPACEQTFDLPAHAERSWTEEITIPAIAASSAKIVGFAQIVQPETCEQENCEPVWLSATFAPFQIEDGRLQGTLDLRTGLVDSATAIPDRQARADRSERE